MKVKLTPEIIEGFQTTYLLPSYDDACATPPCHREWWSMFCSPKQFVAIAAPRRHAKSTSVTHAAGLASIMFRDRRHVLIVSDTEQQASSFLGDMKREIMDNEDLREDFSVGSIIKDAETEFIFQFADGYWVRLVAKGAGQKLRGLKYRNVRPDLILCDDLENDQMVESKERRDKYMRWFLAALIPTLSKRGKVRVVGTVLHFDGLLERLLQNKTWYSKRYEAHDDNFENILWPQMWTKTALLQLYNMYTEDGKPEAYSQEMRNRPIDASTAYFKATSITDYDSLPPGCRYYVGVDLAISKEARRDFTVFAVVAVDFEGLMYLVNVIRERMGPNEIIETFFTLQNLYEPQEFIVENGAIWRGIHPLLATEQLKRGTYLSFPYEKMVPIADKMVRAKPLQARVSAGAFKFNMKAAWSPVVNNEFMTFPAGKHDDVVDACAWVCQRLAKLALGKSPEELQDDALYADIEEDTDEEVSVYTRDSITGY